MPFEIAKPIRRGVTALAVAALLTTGSGAVWSSSALAAGDNGQRASREMIGLFGIVVLAFTSMIGVVVVIDRHHDGQPLASTAGKMDQRKAELVEAQKRLQAKTQGAEAAVGLSTWLFGSFCPKLATTLVGSVAVLERLEVELDTVQVSAQDAKSLKADIDKAERALDGLTESCSQPGG